MGVLRLWWPLHLDFYVTRFAICTRAGEDRGGRHGDGSRGASSSDLSGWESSAAATGGGLDGGGGAAGGALLRSVSRMFREKVQYFGGIEFSGDSILAGARFGAHAHVAALWSCPVIDC